MASSGIIRAWLVTLVLAACMALAWNGALDQLSETRMKNALQQALITYGVARGLNAAISVAQGTEIALQPAGVGVTLSAGEVLDPLNDLIERFSWLVLMASTSIGIQLTLTQAFTSTLVNTLFCGWLGVAIIGFWARRNGFISDGFAYHTIVRITAVIIIVRFTLALATLASVTLSAALWDTQSSVDALSMSRTTIEKLESPVEPPGATSESFAERISSFLEEQKQSINVQSRIDTLKEQAEQSVAHIVNLIVLYLLETLLIPLGILYGFTKLIGATWAALGKQNTIQ